jgi:hypothetical protein
MIISASKLLGTALGKPLATILLEPVDPACVGLDARATTIAIWPFGVKYKFST